MSQQGVQVFVPSEMESQWWILLSDETWSFAGKHHSWSSVEVGFIRQVLSYEGGHP